MADEKGLKDDQIIISWKDMVGAMGAENAERLTNQTIAMMKDRGRQVKLGFHMHDTGISADAYAAAILACQKHKWEISVDTAEGQNTGFVSTIELDEAVKRLQGQRGMEETGAGPVRRGKVPAGSNGRYCRSHYG